MRAVCQKMSRRENLGAVLSVRGALRSSICAEHLKAGRYFTRCRRAMAGKSSSIGHCFTPSNAARALHVCAGQENLARNYFSLDHPLRSIYAKFPSDPFSRSALSTCRGLRILRQPTWECLATFIASPMKQVGHIRQISLELRRTLRRTNFRFAGECLSAGMLDWRDNRGRTPGVQARLPRKEPSRLRDRNCIRGSSISTPLAEKQPAVARDRLCSLPGVGRKVANCVLLFAYERLDVVPVDIWIARVLHAMHKRSASLSSWRKFSNRQFGSYAGYIQQYLFHHARMSKTLPA